MRPRAAEISHTNNLLQNTLLIAAALDNAPCNQNISQNFVLTEEHLRLYPRLRYYL